MAAPGKSSKWGSFLSQAVAGVESRLDNMLAEAEAEQGGPAATRARSARPAAPAKQSPANSRSSSNARVNDRLQARLAKAMAGKNTPGSADGKDAASPRSSVDQASRPSIERSSTDKEAADSADVVTPGATIAPAPPVQSDTPDTESSRLEDIDTQEPSARDENTEQAPAPARPETPAGAEITDAPGETSDLLKELEETRLRQQEEIQEYVERIDSLQSKIQYLSKNAVDSAKQAAASAAGGSLERKLAEKDEKIALLMEEGQKLSSAEQKFRATIKKLRLQMVEHEKQTENLKRGGEKAAAEAEALRSRLNGSLGDEKQQEEVRQATTALQKEIASLKKELAKKDDTCRQLGNDARQQYEKAQAASAEALSKALAAEQEKQKELHDTISSLQAERDALSEKARQDNEEWEGKLERASERSRRTEEEMRLELRSMESKLEAMRTAAEEASSSSGGEAQIKMFRQIETLQSQYVSARENWQGIESSLLAKAAGLERERDEAQRRESEMRKKARDASTRCRSLEEELQDVQPALAAARQELDSCRDQLAALKTQVKTAEAALEQARAEFDKERQRLSSRDDPVEAERRRWVDDVVGATSRGQQSRPASPLLPISRTLSSDLSGIPAPTKLRRTPTPAASIAESPADFMSSLRRLSSQPPNRFGMASTGTPTIPSASYSPFDAPSEAPPIPSPTGEHENGVDDTASNSPHNIAQDMISASTVAAGPSVQLVERMSAAIRRLEAEKVAAKEEMARVCNQRDEARADMVSLMKDLDEAKTAAQRIPQLEEQVTDLDSRYQTTLEMLGEKSELVDELRADIQDVKAMYRELVERTV
ncbi:hypothetical protein HIM_01233 [Hirsutella minnesotensis 3608]|nr:hypothetical protein HIM_01233 [Hirsutella minnesotensis 3608]